MNRQEKAHEGVEERMQSANKAWWRDVKIYRSEDVHRGERSAEGWWNTSVASFLLEVKIGPGARKVSTESKDEKQRR